MVTASFKEGQKTAITTSLQKYDYGEVLRIKGLSLPRYVAVQFAVDGMSEALPSSIGETVEDVTDVLIPNSLLRSNIKPWNYNIMAYVYIISGSSGKTEYTITIPVKWRPKTGDDQAADDDVAAVIGSAVEKMNTATTKAENAANQASATAEEIKADREKITTNEVEISGLQSDIAKYQNIITNASFLYINKKVSISATQNNDGDATYVQKTVVKKAVFSDNYTFYISVSDIIGAPAKNAIVIRQFSNDGSKIKDIYVTAEQAKSIYRIDKYSEDCLTFDVMLYPTMSGGLNNSAAIYSDVMIYSLPVDDVKIIINDDILPSDILRYKQVLSKSKWNIIPDISGWERGNINPATGEDAEWYQNARTIKKIPINGSKYCFEYFGNKAFVLYVLCYTSTSYLKRLQGNVTTDKKRVEFEMPSGTDHIRLSVYNEWASKSTPVSEMVPTNANLGLDVYYGERIFDCISTEKIEPHSIGEDKLSIDVVDKLNSINSEKIPSYYYNDDYIEKRINQINNLIYSNIANGDAFIAVADEHIDQIKGTANSMQTPRLLRYVREKTRINRLFSLGDAADGGSLTVASAYRDAFDGDIHHLCGNHEYFGSGNGNNLYAIYDMFNDNQNGNPYRHYYYVDDVQKKNRYIILSSHSEKTSVEQIGASAGYEDDQINWLQNTALNVQEDWGIIVFTHEIFQSGEIGNETIWNPAQRVVNILDNYTGKGEIIAVFQGEIHVDSVRHTPGGIPVISITCNKFKSYMENGKELEPYLHNRIEGTITEQAFDVVIIDRVQRKIHAVRIGGYSTWDDNTDAELMVAGERIISFKPQDIN